MSTPADNARTLRGREILGSVADLLSAWFALGGTLADAWRTVDAEKTRVGARPLVEAFVRRCNEHRQAAWIEFAAACKKWHYKSRDGHFTLFSPRSFQDRGRRRAEPFTDAAALKLLLRFRQGRVRAQD